MDVGAIQADGAEESWHRYLAASLDDREQCGCMLSARHRVDGICREVFLSVGQRGLKVVLWTIGVVWHGLADGFGGLLCLI
jgi:hypothetical protein